MSTQLAISIEHLSKYYRLGLIGGGTLNEDINRAWARIRGRPDPLLKIGEEDHGNRKGDMIWALRDINLDVLQGEVLGVIGHNGAGKSTLLKILSRITAPTEGRAVIHGRVGSLLEVGTGFHPELTGRENTYLNGTILGMSRAEVRSKLDEIVEFAEMSKFIDTPVKRYSSGMLVRLAFAVAAHLEPEILIVDEVLAVGDLRFQKKCLGKMKDVSSHGRTVLFVSHNMAAIESLCTTCVILDRGSVSERQAPRTAVMNYANQQNNFTKTSLDQRTDRTGRGDVKITGIEILNSREELTDTIPVGESMRLRFGYRARNDHRDVRVVVGIYDQNNIGVLRFDTQMDTREIAVKQGDGYFECITENMPVVPGSYFMNIALFAGGEMEDYIQNASTITFISVDYFNNGRFITDTDAGLMKVLVRHKWNVIHGSA